MPKLSISLSNSNLFVNKLKHANILNGGSPSGLLFLLTSSTSSSNSSTPSTPTGSPSGLLFLVTK